MFVDIYIYFLKLWKRKFYFSTKYISLKLRTPIDGGRYKKMK